VGIFDKAKKLLAGETISFERTTHVNLAANLLTGDKESYIGEWRSPNTILTIKADGTVDYHREETVGDTTNTDSVSGPIDSFEGPSFLVGVLGHNKRFEVAEPPSEDDDGRMTMTVNGERLEIP